MLLLLPPALAACHPPPTTAAAAAPPPPPPPPVECVCVPMCPPALRPPIRPCPVLCHCCCRPTRDKVLVVDVRDSDFVGGHIKGAVNIVSHAFQSDSEVCVGRGMGGHWWGGGEAEAVGSSALTGTAHCTALPRTAGGRHPGAVLCRKEHCCRSLLP